MKFFLLPTEIKIEPHIWKIWKNDIRIKNLNLHILAVYKNILAPAI